MRGTRPRAILWSLSQFSIGYFLLSQSPSFAITPAELLLITFQIISIATLPRRMVTTPRPCLTKPCHLALHILPLTNAFRGSAQVITAVSCSRSAIEPGSNLGSSTHRVALHLAPCQSQNASRNYSGMLCGCLECTRPRPGAGKVSHRHRSGLGEFLPNLCFTVAKQKEGSPMRSVVPRQIFIYLQIYQLFTQHAFVHWVAVASAKTYVNSTHESLVDNIYTSTADLFFAPETLRQAAEQISAHVVIENFREVLVQEPNLLPEVIRLIPRLFASYVSTIRKNASSLFTPAHHQTSADLARLSALSFFESCNTLLVSFPDLADAWVAIASNLNVIRTHAMHKGAADRTALSSCSQAALQVLNGSGLLLSLRYCAAAH